AFLRQVIDDAASRLGIDPDRVILVGHSHGAFLVWELVCDAAGLGRGFIPINGTFYGRAPIGCVGGGAMLHLHGANDLGVPVAGRRAGVKPLYAPATLGPRLIRFRNGCAGDAPEQEDLPGRGYRLVWPGCDPATPLELAVVPGGPQINQGMVAMALDWAEALVAPGAAISN
ncbi:MAG: hypothetical protein AAF908_02070, partial [Pseudomonadota bacterium]